MPFFIKCFRNVSIASCCDSGMRVLRCLANASSLTWSSELKTDSGSSSLRSFSDWLPLGGEFPELSFGGVGPFVAYVRAREDVIREDSRDGCVRREVVPAPPRHSVALLENRAILPGRRRREAMVEGREAQRAERARKGGDQSDSGAMDNSAQSIEGIEVVSVKLSSCGQIRRRVFLNSGAG
jgi:hypothetical protein